MAEVLEKWTTLGQKRGHVNNQFVTCGSVPGADLIGHVVWLPEAGSCHTLPSKADGLTPNSAPDAIKFQVIQASRPEMSPVAHAHGGYPTSGCLGVVHQGTIGCAPSAGPTRRLLPQMA